MGFIYKIENSINDKIYIGLTKKKRPTDRFSQHRYQARHLKSTDKSLLHKAMAKYGVDNFSFSIIEEVDNNIMPQREQYWIEYYNSITPNGYNITKGGEGTPGFSRTQTKEEREKRKNSNKKFFEEHPEKRKEISQRTQKLWQDPEYRKKVTESNKRFYREHPNMFTGENNPFYGKHHTDETKQKIRSKSLLQAIAQLDKETYEVIKVYDGIKAAEKALNVSHGWLSKAAKLDKIAYGYRWKLLESVTTNCSSEISAERSGEPL